MYVVGVGVGGGVVFVASLPCRHELEAVLYCVPAATRILVRMRALLGLMNFAIRARRMNAWFWFWDLSSLEVTTARGADQAPRGRYMYTCS
jgi:hypothetical protein